MRGRGIVATNRAEVYSCFERANLLTMEFSISRSLGASPGLGKETSFWARFAIRRVGNGDGIRGTESRRPVRNGGSRFRDRQQRQTALLIPYHGEQIDHAPTQAVPHSVFGNTRPPGPMIDRHFRHSRSISVNQNRQESMQSVKRKNAVQRRAPSQRSVRKRSGSSFGARESLTLTPALSTAGGRGRDGGICPLAATVFYAAEQW